MFQTVLLTLDKPCPRGTVTIFCGLTKFCCLSGEYIKYLLSVNPCIDESGQLFADEKLSDVTRLRIFSCELTTFRADLSL